MARSWNNGDRTPQTGGREDADEAVKAPVRSSTFASKLNCRRSGVSDAKTWGHDDYPTRQADVNSTFMVPISPSQS
jgi:hypothetical protein